MDEDGVALSFYVTDNGEGSDCAEAGNGCEGREGATRMYYDELKYVVEGGHYG